MFDPPRPGDVAVLAALAGRWLIAALPSLALDAYAGEREITAVCEVALLAKLLSRASPPSIADALAATLPNWLALQARSPAILQLVETGPPLALVGPLILHAALGDRSPFDGANLTALAAARDVADACPTYWRQLELAKLVAEAGGDYLAPTLPRFVDSVDLAQGFSVDDAYVLTHEVFHVTDFGARHEADDWSARAIALLTTTVDGVLDARHLDLAIEYCAAIRCLGGARHIASSGRLRALMATGLSPDYGQKENALVGYHPRLVMIIAALCSSGSER